MSEVLFLLAFLSIRFFGGYVSLFFFLGCVNPADVVDKQATIFLYHRGFKKMHHKKMMLLSFTLVVSLLEHIL